MLIGFGALYLEFKTPGLSVFGVIGVLCLATVFGSKYAVGLANHTELILLLAGFALFFVEMYLFPGTLIAGALGVLLVIAALTLSLQTFTLPDPQMPWELKSLVDNLFMTVGTAVLAVLIPLVAIRFLLPRLAGPAKVIADTTLADARSVSLETSRISIGFSGYAKTPLRPTGKASFGDLTLEVSSRGEFIDPGQAVEVCQIVGNKIVVRPKESGGNSGSDA
jgi:membrane-bound serine protease (ClpP class)